MKQIPAGVGIGFRWGCFGLNCAKSHNGTIMALDCAAQMAPEEAESYFGQQG